MLKFNAANVNEKGQRKAFEFLFTTEIFIVELNSSKNHKPVNSSHLILVK